MTVPLSCWFNISCLLPQTQVLAGASWGQSLCPCNPLVRMVGEGKPVFSLNRKQNFLDSHLLSWKEETTSACGLSGSGNPPSGWTWVRLESLYRRRLIRILRRWDSKLTAHEQGNSWLSPILTILHQKGPGSLRQQKGSAANSLALLIFADTIPSPWLLQNEPTPRSFYFFSSSSAIQNYVTGLGGIVSFW